LLIWIGGPEFKLPVALTWWKPGFLDWGD